MAYNVFGGTLNTYYWPEIILGNTRRSWYPGTRIHDYAYVKRRGVSASVSLRRYSDHDPTNACLIVRSPAVASDVLTS